LEVLPGDGFCWDSKEKTNPAAEWVRIPLLRDAEYFKQGLKILTDAVASVNSYEPVESADIA
jgi:hypothetical protein